MPIGFATGSAAKTFPSARSPGSAGVRSVALATADGELEIR